MKKIIFILLITIASSNAKPCMTDIYFGNGVWNTQKQGKEGKDELKFFMQYRANSRLNIQKEGIEYDFKHAYNPSEGTSNDLLETFYQLKESGQISNNYFLWIFTLLNTDETTEPYQKLQDIIRTHNDDTFYMFTKYENESFNQKHNVLLVAHSQGNLFGNKIYTFMNDEQKEKFRMVSVATPASTALGNLYVTATKDYVIGPIPNSLPGNVVGTGHTFMGTYLNIDGAGVIGDGSDTAPIVIGQQVIHAYNNLMQTTSCNEYWAINMTLHTEGYMEVLGYLILGGRDTYASSPIGQVNFPTYPLVEERDQSGSLSKICGLTPDKVKYWNDIDLCYTNTVDDTCGWKAGEIYSKSTLEARKNLSYTMASKDYTKCINISHSGELYELTKDIFE